MKKLIALILAAVLCLGALAGCNNAPVDDKPVVNALENAKAYLFTMYKDLAPKTMRDFDLVGVVNIGGVSYTVEWSANVSEDLVKVVHYFPADGRSYDRGLRRQKARSCIRNRRYGRMQAW